MDESAYDSLNPDMKSIVDQQVEMEKSRWVRGHFDFCIINSEEDQEEVDEFREEFSNKHKALGVVECDPQMLKIGDYFDRIEEMVKRSTYVFLYLTNNFGKDKMCLRHRSDLLTRFIEDKSLSLIPIYTKAEYVTLTPSGLRGVTGFKLFVKNGDNFRIKSTFSEEARKRRVQRERIETQELRLREFDLKEQLARELVERRASQQSQKSDASGPSGACKQTIQQISAENVGNMHVGHVYNINVMNSEDVSSILEQLSVDEDDN